MPCTLTSREATCEAVGVSCFSQDNHSYFCIVGILSRCKMRKISYFYLYILKTLGEKCFSGRSFFLGKGPIAAVLRTKPKTYKLPKMKFSFLIFISFIKLESLGQSELASRLTLNCQNSYVEPHKIRDIPVTIMDVSWSCFVCIFLYVLETLIFPGWDLEIPRVILNTWKI